MILFVFEGDKREPRLYRTLERLYFQKVKDNWQYLKQMNVCKANLITSGQYIMPTEKSAVNQLSVFKNQVAQYVKPSEHVAILNSFPLFIYEYMK